MRRALLCALLLVVVAFCAATALPPPVGGTDPIIRVEQLPRSAPPVLRNSGSAIVLAAPARPREPTMADIRPRYESAGTAGSFDLQIRCCLPADIGRVGGC
jgi:hypothetical protein